MTTERQPQQPECQSRWTMTPHTCVLCTLGYDATGAPRLHLFQESGIQFGYLCPTSWRQLPAGVLMLPGIEPIPILVDG